MGSLPPKNVFPFVATWLVNSQQNHGSNPSEFVLFLHCILVTKRPSKNDPLGSVNHVCNYKFVILPLWLCILHFFSTLTNFILLDPGCPHICLRSQLSHIFILGLNKYHWRYVSPTVIVHCKLLFCICIQIFQGNVPVYCRIHWQKRDTYSHYRKNVSSFDILIDLDSMGRGSWVECTNLACRQADQENVGLQTGRPRKCYMISARAFEKCNRNPHSQRWR